MALLAPWRKSRCRSCGVPWPCDEARKQRLRQQLLLIRNDRTGAWAAGLIPASPPVSPPSNLTAAHAWRMTGSRR